MKIKASVYLLFCGILLMGTACSEDEMMDPTTEEYPKTVNLKFEVLYVGGPDQPTLDITTTINNTDEGTTTNVLPYSETFAQTTVEKNTYLKLNIQDIGSCDYGYVCNFSTALRILVDEELVKADTFAIDDSQRAAFIDYTFE